MKKYIFSLLACLPLLSYAQDPEVLSGESLLINRIFKDGYHKMSPDSIMEVFLPRVWKEKESLMIRHSAQPGDAAAIGHYYGHILFSLSESIMQSFNRDQPWKQLADAIFDEIALPSLAELQNSAAADLFLDKYIIYSLQDLFLLAREKKEEGDPFIEQQFGLPVDSLQAISSRYGELTFGVLYASKYLSPALAGHYLTGQLSDQLDRKNLGMAGFILEALQSNFPDHSSIAKAEVRIAELHQVMAQQAKNPDIIFIEHPESIRSVADLVAPYSGKVVYLDFWGTWCGPCITELTQYTSALKSRFKDEEDIVFLYLAMEQPFDYEKWKEFILLHELTGSHLTLTNQTIEPFWEELLGTKDVPRQYPTYMIFDRKGKIVTTEAPRPSHGEVLYLQLEEQVKR